MRIEELQQERLPFLRRLSGTRQVCRRNLLPLAYQPRDLGVAGGCAAAFSAMARHVPVLAITILATVLAATLVVVPGISIGIALGFYAVLAVLRPGPWTGPLSRSWALIGGRRWRAPGLVLVLALPGQLLTQLQLHVMPQTIPLRVGSALVQLLLNVLGTVGMTLLFLHLDFLGPAAVPAAGERVPAIAEVTP